MIKITSLLISLMVSSGTWLEDTTNWNIPNAAIPLAPQIDDGGNLANCTEDIRPAIFPEDKQLEAAGWTITGAAQVFGKTTVITAMANADGMCRPLDYQVFVFTDGQFSGTLSPETMNSRTDGSLAVVTLYREGYLVATFQRYTDSDPLCCPSGSTQVIYEVKIEDGYPVLVPQLPGNNSV